jgi:hypothetical protein
VCGVLVGRRRVLYVLLPFGEDTQRCFKRAGCRSWSARADLDVSRSSRRLGLVDMLEKLGEGREDQSFELRVQN